jgi:hypothetical protein
MRLSKKEKALIEKAKKVIKSCQTLEQLESAKKFCSLVLDSISRTSGEAWHMFFELDIFKKHLQPYILIKQGELEKTQDYQI